MGKKTLYPHVPKSKKVQFPHEKSPDERRATTVHDRFTIDCSYCGFVTSRMTLSEALEAAKRLATTSHASLEERITVFDLMAKRGACNTWDAEGKCIGYKEWR